MVTTSKKNVSANEVCPHCSSNFIAWDGLENEAYCYICGWRKSIRITKEQAKHRFRTERDFWNNLFASEKDPDDHTGKQAIGSHPK